MCRILGYVGPPIALDALLYGHPHSLEHQAYSTRFQEGRINADGWGVAWYEPDVRPEPARYRTATPMWADDRFRGLAPFQRSGHAIAAVRNASPGSPVEETGSSPFVADRWAFTHNGYVAGFRDGLGVQLRRGVSERREAGILGAADSEVVFALILDLLDKGTEAAAAVRTVIGDLLAVTDGKFNVLLTDGTTLLATREGNSLFVREDAAARVIASEPLDDGEGWTEIPDHSLVTVTADRLTTEAL